MITFEQRVIWRKDPKRSTEYIILFTPGEGKVVLTDPWGVQSSNEDIILALEYIDEILSRK